MTATSELSSKVASGESFSEADLCGLAHSRDLLELGMLAELARTKRHGSRVTYVRVIDLPGAEAVPPIEGEADAGEWRITGAVADAVTAARTVESVVQRAGRVPVSGFSLDRLETLAGTAGLAEILARLRGAGLALVADAALDRLRAPERSIEAVFRAGLGLARLIVDSGEGTGHVDLVLRAAMVQRAVGALRSFAPLPRRPPGTSTGYDDVRLVAMARLGAAAIPSIQVDWAVYGAKLAQVALMFGADDLDAVPALETGELGPRRAHHEEVRRNIRAAALEPVERNARFEVV
jgi:aminodeoxyfutalosine synthase